MLSSPDSLDLYEMEFYYPDDTVKIMLSRSFNLLTFPGQVYSSKRVRILWPVTKKCPS